MSRVADSILPPAGDLLEFPDETLMRELALEKEEFLGVGSWEYDLAGNAFSWSDGMYRLFGYEVKEVESRVPVDENLYSLHLKKEDLEKGKTRLNEALEEGLNSYVSSYQITNLKGETRMLESFYKIVRSETGKGIKVLGTTRDITQFKKYEHDLEQKIAEVDLLTKELEDSTYAASHDLQEPLRKIATLTDRLKTKFNEVLPEDGQKYVERIQEASKNARMLIDSLLEFSRITHSKQIVETVDLNLLIQEVKAELELKIEETHAVIRIGQLPVLEIFPMSIRRLFSNLILNAIKFKKPSEIPVIDIQCRILEKAETELHDLDASNSYFLITVADNGIGFENAYATKIFQMFSRLHGKSEYPGAGIGLALCRKIVHHHGGKIVASGIPDQGAVFSIILPEYHG